MFSLFQMFRAVTRASRAFNQKAIFNAARNTQMTMSMFSAPIMTTTATPNDEVAEMGGSRRAFSAIPAGLVHINHAVSDLCQKGT